MTTTTGAGRSTTIDMLLGLCGPDDGEASLFGRTPDKAVAEGMVGAMLRAGTFLPDITVGEVGVGLLVARRYLVDTARA